MMRRRLGAVHLHTTYSHDGVLSLAELAEFLRRKGYDFMAVTDHSQDLTESMLAEMERESAALSGNGFLVIPGVEFECAGKIHILGLGVTRLCPSDRPRDVIEHIHAVEGLAVLAHPAHMEYPLDPAWVGRLDGCEIWNNREGKWLPQLRSIRKFQDLKAQAPGLRAFAGLDLHSPVSFSRVAMNAEIVTLSRSAVLDSLGRGAYNASGHLLSINSDGRLSWAKMMYLYVLRTALNIIRLGRDRITSKYGNAGSGSQ